VNLSFKDINELLEMALRTTSLDEMLFLNQHPSMNVRRALARNSNLPQDIINKLINDPIQNVSYMAYIHPKNKNFEKEFESQQRPCVVCQKNEIGLVCTNCDLVQDHNF